MKFVKKPKRNLAIWREAFPDQARKLRPENSRAGGVRARSVPESVRMAVYNEIKKLFISRHPRCQGCRMIFIRYPNPATQIHHLRGRDGWLLVDIRFWVSMCQECHDWVGNNIADARKLNLIADSGDWRKASE